jgi:aryl-alcohol dehydrogenase-like predicted oxidoreductase
VELILGTAQLTRRYGIVARGEAPDAGSADVLLRTAHELGVGTVDTAPAYGDAEAAIGRSGFPFAVHTKLDPTLAPEASLTASLERLDRQRVDILHLHDPEAVFDPSRLHAARCLVGERVGTLGASVYTTAAAEAALAAGLGAVQVPLNLLDRRFDDGLLARLATSGVQVLVRSALLQGLLADPQRGLGRVPGLDRALSSVLGAARELEREPFELALGWVRARPGVDAVVLGAEDADQLRRLRAALDAAPLEAQELVVLEAVDHDAGLPVDPRGWLR